MARIETNQIEKVEQNLKSASRKRKWFKLANHGDKATVRFLSDSVEEMDTLTIHKVENADGYNISVNCLRGADDPVTDCPLCERGLRAVLQFYVPLFNESTGEVEMWNKGIKLRNQINALQARYPNLTTRTFDIERIGERGSTDTTYQIFPNDVSQGDTYVSPDVIDDGYVVDATYDELRNYVDNGAEIPTLFTSASGGQSVPTTTASRSVLGGTAQTTVRGTSTGRRRSGSETEVF